MTGTTEVVDGRSNGGQPSLLRAAQAGDRRAIARLLSLAEVAVNRGRSEVETERTMAAVYQAAGGAHVIGVTGPPGAGKSSLVTAMVKQLRAGGQTVGVVAVDPSSPFSGGAILGDRVRMGDLGGDDGVFIRSLATQGAMGGLARPALDAVDVLDAVGFQIVIIETVGVGQDEVDIAAAAETVIVANPPGLGDGVQAIKAGLLEIADIHVVTKADRPQAEQLAADLRAAADLGRPGRPGAGSWITPVVSTSVNGGIGVDELVDEIGRHRRHLATGEGQAQRCRHAARLRLEAALHDHVGHELRRLGGDLDRLVDDLMARRTTPRAAGLDLLSRLCKG